MSAIKARGKRNGINDAWLEEPPSEDTAPTWSPDAPRVSDWGVTQEEARELLRQRRCPICGKGPYKVPLIHTGKFHGIDRFTLRDICGLTTAESLIDPEYRERLSEMNKGRDMSLVNHKGKPRRKQRWTRAGRDKNAATLAAWEAANPEEATEQRLRAAALARASRAQAKRSATLRAQWANAPKEARDAVRDRLARTPEEMSRQSREAWERRGLQPCGTRAAYRRGCRCEECRSAYLAYRKEHG